MLKVTNKSIRGLGLMFKDGDKIVEVSFPKKKTVEVDIDSKVLEDWHHVKTGEIVFEELEKDEKKTSPEKDGKKTSTKKTSTQKSDK